MREFMAITKALADPGRVRILLALRRRELCVCQITELFGFAPSTMSKHLSILHHAGLIQSRKTERWVHYRLPTQAKADAQRLGKILRMNLKEICRRQCRRRGC
jgi:ArsR family transcriptional regulator